MPYNNYFSFLLALVLYIAPISAARPLHSMRNVPTIGETFSLLEQTRGLHSSRDGESNKSKQQARPFGVKAAECSAGLWTQLAQKEEMDDARNHRKLYDLCNVLSKGAGPEKLAEILGLAHTIIQQFKDPELQKCASACVLINASITMAELARREIVQAIDQLQEILDYWIEQRHHAVRYFFHKSPFKWFEHRSQTAEIEQNIKAVRDMQAQYFTFFGQLAAQLEHFSSSERDLQALFVWFDSFAQVVHYMCAINTQKTHVHTSDAAPTYEKFQQLAHKLCFKTGRIARLKKPVMWSHHLVRNWLSYTALAAAGVATTTFVIQHPNEAAAYLTRMQKKGKEVYGWVADKLLEVWDVIIPVKEKAESADPDKMLPAQWASEAKLLNSTWSKESLESVNKAIEVGNLLVQRKVITEQRRDEIVRGVLNGSLTKLTELLWGAASNVPWSWGVIPNPKEWFSSTLDSLFAVGYPYYNRALHVTQKVNKQTSLLIGISLAAVLGLTSHRLITYLMTPRPIDYSHIRIALADAARVLNLYSGYDSSMTIYSEDLGRFLYSIERLYKEMRVIREPERWEFARDLQQLAQPQLSVSQKLRLIDIMYKRYPFLVQQ